ncbi:flavodoxin family protein [Aquimarina muelleri]|uniref:flavodoxin family protein n=1 Tax=Aquimarina muelleri TaxID=279356 RepID=UPI003F6843B2
MKNKGVILQGSSRSDGNTNTIALFVKEKTGFDIIDLKSKNIGAFDYGFKNRNDDFIPLMRDIVDNYDTFIFATPVYWYTMSGILKNFIDRISDCLKTEKEIGYKLREKKMALISCGSDCEIKEGFTMPFIETANYLNMEYLGDIHTWIEDGIITKKLKKDLDVFIYLM